MKILIEQIKLKIQDITPETIELEIPKIKYEGNDPKGVELSDEFKVIYEEDISYLLFAEISLVFWKWQDTNIK